MRVRVSEGEGGWRFLGPYFISEHMTLSLPLKMSCFSLGYQYVYCHFGRCENTSKQSSF